MRAKPIIAIDGPSGAGKTTIARLTANALGYLYIDTGAMYRCVGLAAGREALPKTETHELTELLKGLTIRFQKRGDDQGVYLNNEDVTETIRNHEVSSWASDFSTLPAVRSRLVSWQREMGKNGGVVMEGRDIGTNVFPDAELKVFLTASAEVRARRRYLELQQRGQDVSFEKILEDQIQRDRQDASRVLNPLKPAEGSWLLDTSDLTVQEIVDAIVHKAAESLPCARPR